MQWINTKYVRSTKLTTSM